MYNVIEKQDSKQTIAIGSSVGVVFLFFTFISLVVILMVVYHRTKKRQGKLDKYNVMSAT